jgi:Fe-S cluster assembly protein SufD
MREKRFKGNTDWYQNIFERFEQRLNGESGSGVHDLRKKAMAHFTGQGYPTTRDEEWKYTSIRPITEIDFEPEAALREDGSAKQLLKKYNFDGLDCCHLVFVNGHFSSALSSLHDAPAGVRIMSVRDALKNGEPEIEKYLSRYTDENGDAFTALNTAFLWDGVFIFVPDNQQLDKPVAITYLGLPDSRPLLNMPRSLFVLGKNSQASVIETFSGTGEQPYFTNTVSEIVIGPNAGFDHLRLQVESDNAYHISTTQVDQQKDSRYTSHAFSFGGRLVRNNINLVLKGEGIESMLNGLYVGTGGQHIDNHTSIDHAKPNCHSEELYKGVLDDQAHGVFNGKIFVRPDAQKTNAIQANNCILLSDSANIDTKPQLEIFADDVRCTHGATVGQLDEDAYFYMRSRGIDKARARQLLIYAFASDVIDRVASEPVREKLSAVLADKLHTVKPQ